MCVLNRMDRCIASLLAIDSIPAHRGFGNGRDRFIASCSAVDCQRGRDTLVPTIAESSLPQEDFVVQRWESLPPGTYLPLMDGETCQLVFAGRAGGPVGPDVRDAVLIFPDGEQRVGDIEFHVRSSDWVAHKHSTDPRYNSVMLHVVLLCDDLHPTTRQDRYSIPVCSLYDLPIVIMKQSDDAASEAWPCHSVMRNLSVAEQEKLLHRAGLLRFEQKTHVFVEALHKIEANGCLQTGRHDRGKPCHYYTRTGAASHPMVGSIVVTGLAPVMPSPTPFDGFVGCNLLSCRLLSDLYNACLIPALAEALAYGRDRAFFRAAGQRLLDQNTYVPEPLGSAPAPSPLDAKRLKVLRTLLAREPNVWESLQHMLVQVQQDTTLQALRDYFCAIGLSLARADILICNVR